MTWPGKGLMMYIRNRRGVTQIDLIVSCVCFGIICALSATVVQQNREDTRAETCRDRMREIAVIVHIYSDAHSRLPAGTLGSSAIPKLEKWNNNGWRDHQFTSSLAVAMQLNGMFDEKDSISEFAFDFRRTFNVILDANGKQAFQWFGELKGFPNVLKIKNESAFLCPADGQIDKQVEFVIAVHPVLPKLRQKSFDNIWLMTLSDLNKLEPATASWNKLKPLSRTSYLACGGAHSGGDQPDPELSPYDGAMSTRDSITLESVAQSDGTARTIMYGESIGEFNNHRRTHVQTFFLGGLARGRGVLKWEEKPTANRPILGQPLRSTVYGFGSMHRSFVNFAFCDASTQSISREVDHEVFNQMCGMNDNGFANYKKYYVEE